MSKLFERKDFDNARFKASLHDNNLYFVNQNKDVFFILSEGELNELLDCVLNDAEFCMRRYG